MNPRSLSFRLSVWYAGICLVVILGFSAYSYLWLRSYLTTSLSGTLERRAAQISSLWGIHSGAAGEKEVMNDIKVSYAPEYNDRFIRIKKDTGELLYQSGRPVDGTFDPNKIAALPFPENDASVLHRLVAENMLIASRRFSTGGSRYIIEVGSSLENIRKVLGAYFIMLLVGIPVVMVITIGGGAVLVQWSLNPVRQIIRVAQDITYHNLRSRLPVAKTGDELENLSLVLNQMIDRLDVSFQHSKRFAALASHELRTPLTIILGELETVLRDRDLSESAREKVGSVYEEAEHLAKIVEGLFAITRMEAGEALSDVTTVNLSMLVVSTSEQMTLLAEEKNLTVHCETEPNLEITGDKVRLKQVIVNLLDNAIKYSPENKSITLRTTRANDHAVLTIADEGYGISNTALPHIFDTFYRSRDEQTQKTEGVGLGLSIVRSICTAHRATIEAANRPEGGCIVTIRIPLKKGTL
ncbi:MAG: ATP-binding protein [Chthoniobacterales bacterium]